MSAQMGLALDNLEAVLAGAGMTLSNLVRLNFYTTDIPAFMGEAAPVLGARLGAAHVMPAGTLLGVASLAFPELMVEIEGTAVA
jgi:enamine deaminase RidA (YjgF/YER057c/UK114 family)